jgi:hypothetical protein
MASTEGDFIMAGRDSGKKKAERIRQLFVQSDNPHRKKWRKQEQLGYDFSLNDQLTKKQLKDLDSAGMPTFIINMITPILEIMKYFLTAKNPRWNAVGADGSDTDIASVHSSLTEYCWYISSGRQVFSQIVDDALRKSRGYMHIYVDPNADRGLGEVKFDFVSPWDVYEDVVGRDIFGRDRNFKMIKKNLTKSTLIQQLPKYKTKIKAASGQQDSSYASQRDSDDSPSIQTEDISYGTDPEGKDEQLISYYECYEKVQISFVRVFIKIPPTESEMEKAQKTIDIQIKELKQELEVQYKEKADSLAKAVTEKKVIPERAKLELERAGQMMNQAVAEKQQLLFSRARDEMSKIEDKIVTADEYKVIAENKEFMENVVSVHEFFEPRIQKTCVVGDKLLYEQIIDIKDYPLISLPFTHTGTPYSMSAVTPLVGKQQEINKAHQITIHNANLGSNLRWLALKGQIDNKNEWEEYSSSAGAVLEYNDLGTGEAPKEILPKDLNNAFFTLTQSGKGDMEYMSGISSSMMGMENKERETYRGMLAQDEFGTRRLKSWINNVLEPFLEHVGQVFQQIAQKHYTVHKVFRIVQPNAEGGNHVIDDEINVPLYSDFGDVIGRYKDYATARFDVRIVPGSTMPVNRWALIEEYFKWYEADLIDDIAMLAETDIKNKEQIMKRKSVYKQQEAMIEQLREALKNEQGTVETLQRQVVQKKIDVEALRIGSEFRKDLLETKSKLDDLINIVNTDVEYTKKKAKDDAKRITDERKNTPKKDKGA